ncbi:MAG: DUF4231 domain-containing protein [Pseudomonadota bacterium]
MTENPMVDERAEAASRYDRLEEQLSWFDRNASTSQRSHKMLRFSQIMLAALIPVSALLSPGSALAPGLLGAAVLILDGALELGAYQRNWVNYRRRAELLRREKHLYEGAAGPYQGMDPEDARRTLIVRVEDVIGQETTDWATHMTALKAGAKRKA